MVRIARVVLLGYPHHVTQRGNRRQQTFFNNEDYEFYLDLMSEWCGKYQVDIWAYCLMPNHIYLIAVPQTKEGLNLAVGEAHRRYTRRINFREGWRGHLWQGRFASFVMEEFHLLACAKYIELNPVRAGLVKRPEEWPWSSAESHINMKDDGLIKIKPLVEMVNKPWNEFLSYDVDEIEMEVFRKSNRGTPYLIIDIL